MQPDKIDEPDKIKQLTKLLRESASLIALDEGERTMVQIEKFLLRTSVSNETTQSFIEEAANTISRMFDFAEMTVALKDWSEGRYKYIAFVGMRSEAVAAYKKLAYTLDETLSPTKFPRIKLDNYIDFFLGEFRPYREGEEETFNRPSQLGKERESLEDMLEGDYICVYIYGPGNEIIGWFELARTMNGKIPTRQTFKWLELMSSIIGKIIWERELAPLHH